MKRIKAINFLFYQRMCINAKLLLIRIVILFAVGPTSVTILNKKDPVSAGKEVDVRCQTVGARPIPTITWWLAGKQVNGRKV